MGPDRRLFVDFDVRNSNGKIRDPISEQIDQFGQDRRHRLRVLKSRARNRVTRKRDASEKRVLGSAALFVFLRRTVLIKSSVSKS